MENSEYRLLTQKNWSCLPLNKTRCARLRRQVDRYEGDVYHTPHPPSARDENSLSLSVKPQTSRGYRHMISVEKAPSSSLSARVKSLKSIEELERLKEPNAYKRVGLKMEFYRTNPDEYFKLHRRVKGKENSGNHTNLPYLKRNIILSLENKPDNILKTLRLRSQTRNRHMRQVADRRGRIDEDRRQDIVQKVNRHELLKRQINLQAKRDRLLRMNGNLIYILARFVGTHRVWKRARELEKEKSIVSHKAVVIQRVWKKNKAMEHGRKYRKAVKIVRDFVIKSRVRLRLKRPTTRADIIYWLIVDIGTSNFQEVVKNFRFRVCTCQRLFRDYKAISEGRMKGLVRLWDKHEAEMISLEKKKKFEQKISSEIEVAKTIIGEEETRNQIKAFFVENPLLKPVNIINQSKSNLKGLKRRLRTLKNMQSIKYICDKISVSFENRNKTQESIFKKKRSRLVPKDLIFKLLFPSTFEYTFQLKGSELLQTENCSQLMLLSVTKNLKSLKDQVGTEISIPEDIKLQILHSYLQEKRAQLKVQMDTCVKNSLTPFIAKKKKPEISMFSWESDDEDHIAVLRKTPENQKLTSTHDSRSHLWLKVYTSNGIQEIRGVFRKMITDARTMGSAQNSSRGTIEE